MKKPFTSRIFWEIILLSVLVIFFMMSREKSLEVYALRLPSGYTVLQESPAHPILQRLRKREKIDILLKDQDTFLKKLAVLTQWTSQQFPAKTLSSLPSLERGGDFGQNPFWPHRRILCVICFCFWTGLPKFRNTHAVCGFNQ